MFNEELKAKAFEAMLVEIVGGREVLVALVRMMEGQSVRSIARDMGMWNSTLTRKIHIAREKLATVGLLTPELERATSNWHGHCRPDHATLAMLES
jgi:predicted transcriptional regulator